MKGYAARTLPGCLHEAFVRGQCPRRSCAPYVSEHWKPELRISVADCGSFGSLRSPSSARGPSGRTYAQRPQHTSPTMEHTTAGIDITPAPAGIGLDPRLTRGDADRFVDAARSRTYPSWYAPCYWYAGRQGRLRPRHRSKTAGRVLSVLVSGRYDAPGASRFVRRCVRDRTLAVLALA